MRLLDRVARTARSVVSLNRAAEVRALTRLMGLTGSERLLDVGSGDGYWSIRFARRAREVVGIDPSGELLAYARALHVAPNLRYDEGLAEELPYGDGTFDRVVAVSVVEHFADPVAALREMSRALRAGGVLAVSVDSLSDANSTSEFREWHSKRHFVTRYFDREQLIEVLESVGLTPLAGVTGLITSHVAGRLRASFIRRPKLLLVLFPAILALCRISDRFGLGGKMPPQILILGAAKSSGRAATTP